MPKVAKTLTKLEVDRLITQSSFGKTNYHRVGGVTGLVLRVSSTNSTSWILRASVGGKQRDIGLGSTKQVTLSRARDLARDYRDLIARGIDPVEQSKRIKETIAWNRSSTITVKEAAIEYHRAAVVPSISVKESKHFLSSLNNHVFPTIGNYPVLELKTEDIRRTFEPIWAEIPRMARDTLARLERVIGYAFVVNGIDDRKNPAQWKNNLELVLPPTARMMRLKNGRVENHHPSLPFTVLPDFLSHLRSRAGNGAKALEFGLFTGARNSEVRFAKWQEFDLREGIWTIPAERTKQSREHVVLLPRQVRELLIGIERVCDYVFPNINRLKPFSDTVFNTLINRMNESLGSGVYIDPKMGGRRVTFHGFRSSLLTWNAEIGGHARLLGEMAIGHQVKSQLEAAYDRSELLVQRKALLQDWADYISVKQGLHPKKEAIK